MMLKNFRKCDKCGFVYDVSPFSNMLANGELAYSQIEIYGDKYDLCPECTDELWKLLKMGSRKG